MKKTRLIRKLNSFKSVSKPGNRFSKATMYFLEPRKSVRKSMIGWLLTAPTGPSDGRIWYDRMKEEREYRLKTLEEIKTHLTTVANAVQTGDRDIFDKAIASLDKMLGNIPPLTSRASLSPTTCVGHFVPLDESGHPVQVQKPTHVKDINMFVKNQTADFIRLHTNIQESPPGKFQINSSYRTPQEHQDLIKRLQDNLRNYPPKLTKDIKLIAYSEPQDKIVPMNVTYQEDDKK